MGLFRPARQWIRTLIGAAAACLCLALGAPAQADDGMFGADSLSAIADFRLVAADGERAWTDGGFGKARFDGTADGDLKVRPVASEVSLIWQPRLSWSLSGTMVAAVQNDQEHPIDIVEAFLTAKPLPSGSTRFSAKVGLYWPAISLEHEGPAWSVADMITPSAINSWIGEEVKVVGAEGTITRDLGGAQMSATGGLFGFNDTSGTLLAFRGWALHDLKATAFGHHSLPPLNDFLVYAQEDRTRSTIEIDHRVGYYAKLNLRLAAPVTLNAFFYNNRGDPEAVTKRLQWGWETKFWNFGARIDLSANTRILAQALTGTTEMGVEEDERYWVETRFKAAYVRLTHRIGRLTFSARYDRFSTRESGFEMSRSERENGWAATAALTRDISSRVKLLAEVLHVDSERGTRIRSALDPRQKQTVLQASLRFGF